jgi:hypothetical protein
MAEEQKSPEGPIRCKWSVDASARAAAGASPHVHKPLYVHASQTSVKRLTHRLSAAADLPFSLMFSLSLSLLPRDSIHS